ncbi:hypothetical protein DCO48_04120 [Pseudomonas sp. SDI]|nr:hypothetical protein DCO48_04120 [Pseudomonas sp. SDI]
MPRPRQLLQLLRYDSLDRLQLMTEQGHVARLKFYRHNSLSSEVQGAHSATVMRHERQLLGVSRSVSGTAQATLLVHDLQCCVLQQLDTESCQRFSYLPFGFAAGIGNAPATLAFNGEHPLPSSAQYLLGNYRVFSPVLMRFTRPDSWSPFGKGGLNAYAYCLGDPLNRTDPSGRSPWQLAKLLVKSRQSAKHSGTFFKPAEIVDQIGADATIFVDGYKGKLRLNISGHGASLPDGSLYLKYGSQNFTVDAIAGSLASQFNLDDFGSIRTLICHSAETPGNISGGRSFAQQLADATQLPVKGFSGEVTAQNLNKKTRRPLAKIGVVKTNPHYNYHALTFYPQTPRTSAIRRP